MKKFTNYVNESLQSSTGVALDAEMIQFIIDSFNIRTQTHIYHLLTKSYAEHMAIGEFYESLEASIDSIAESLIGLDIELNDQNYASNLIFGYNKNTMINQIKSFRSVVSDLIGRTDSNTVMDIQDMLIAVQKTIDTLLYKLQLS